MIKKFVTVEKALDRVKRIAVTVAAEATFMITLFSFAGLDAKAAEAVSFKMPSKEQTETVAILDNSMVSMPVEIEQNRMAVQMEQLKFDTIDKLTDAFFSLHLDDKEYYTYRPLFVQMALPLAKIDIVKAAADTDAEDNSLELVLLLSKGVMVSVEKPVDSMSDNNALVTFVHQREVLYSNVMDMADMAVRIQEMESKLQAL